MNSLSNWNHGVCWRGIKKQFSGWEEINRRKEKKVEIQSHELPNWTRHRQLRNVGGQAPLFLRRISRRNQPVSFIFITDRSPISPCNSCFSTFIIIISHFCLWGFLVFFLFSLDVTLVFVKLLEWSGELCLNCNWDYVQMLRCEMIIACLAASAYKYMYSVMDCYSCRLRKSNNVFFFC